MWRLISSSVVLLLVANLPNVIIAEDLDKVYNHCGDSITCAEKELIQRIDKVDSNRYLRLIGDVVAIEKKQTASTNEGPRGYEDLFDRVARYLSEHEMKVQLPKEALEEVRSSKLKKIILPLLLLLKLKAAIVIPIVLSVIALVAFKSLGASLIALVVSGGSAFKNALEHHHGHNSKLTYEVVPPPMSSGPWSRAGEYYSTGAPPVGAMGPSGYHSMV